MQQEVFEPREALDRLLGACMEELKRRFGPGLVSVVLYGSMARGTARPGSDVDLLVVAEELPSRRWDRQDVAVELSMALEGALEDFERSAGWYPYLSLILKTPAEATGFRRLYLDMVDEARILFDRDGFFAGVLREVEEKIQTLGARRVKVGRRWYWDLKPGTRAGEEFEL